MPNETTKEKILLAVESAPAPLNQVSISRLMGWPGTRQALKRALDDLVADDSLERLPSAPRFVGSTQRGWSGYRYRIARR